MAPESVPTPDGRTLDVYAAPAFIRPWGFDLETLQLPIHIWQGGHDRMVPFAHGDWLARHIPTARPHLLPEHGHLSLAVDSLPLILDQLLQEPGSSTGNT